MKPSFFPEYSVSYLHNRVECDWIKETLNHQLNQRQTKPTTPIRKS